MKKTLLVTVLALLGAGSVFAQQTPQDKRDPVEITRYDYNGGHFGTLLGSSDPARQWWQNNRPKPVMVWCVMVNGHREELWLGPLEGKWMYGRCQDQSFGYQF